MEFWTPKWLNRRFHVTIILLLSLKHLACHPAHRRTSATAPFCVWGSSKGTTNSAERSHMTLSLVLCSIFTSIKIPIFSQLQDPQKASLALFFPSPHFYLPSRLPFCRDTQALQEGFHFSPLRLSFRLATKTQQKVLWVGSSKCENFQQKLTLDI